MTRMLAWAALCVACAPMALLWWPFGMVPAVIVAVLGVRLVLDYTSSDGHAHRGRGRHP